MSSSTIISNLNLVYIQSVHLISKTNFIRYSSLSIRTKDKQKKSKKKSRQNQLKVIHHSQNPNDQQHCLPREDPYFHKLNQLFLINLTVKQNIKKMRKKNHTISPQPQKPLTILFKSFFFFGFTFVIIIFFLCISHSIKFNIILIQIFLLKKRKSFFKTKQKQIKLFLTCTHSQITFHYSLNEYSPKNHNLCSGINNTPHPSCR